MKRTIFVLATMASLGCSAMPAAAQYMPMSAPAYGGPMPAFQVMEVVRTAGLQPMTPPIWMRGRYVIRAMDRRGQEFRLVIDGQYGEILSAIPVVRGLYDDGGPASGTIAGPPIDPRMMQDPRYARAVPPAMPLPSDGPAIRMAPPGGAQIDDADDEASMQPLPPPDAVPHVIPAPRDMSAPAPRSEIAPPRVAKVTPATPMPRARPAEKAAPAAATAQASAQTAAPAAPKVDGTKSADKAPPAVQPADDASKPKLRL